MNALEAVVLGTVQGLTEFLPISSTAHLRIVPAFFDWEDPGAAFTAVTQLGTMAAVLIYFRGDLSRIALAWARGLRDPEIRRTLDSRLGWYIGLGTIPIGLVGFAFQHQIETGARNLWVIGAALILLGLALLYAERKATLKRDVDDIGPRDAAIIGCAQACALIPGVSRSGSTMTAGLLVGLTREAAARYSFLLSIPAVVLSGLLELRKIGEDGGAGIGATVIATILAFAVGYASIAGLLKFLVRHSTMVFVAYRVALGSLVLLLVASGVVAATP
ncbi:MULTISPECIES: undecaprenyl-diphosphate phosphatase [Protofrankia]|uniref:Undecaprenyl-diphosphatase n=2 Tax=Frankiaceae TaxID=74712 RepID=A0ABR5F2T4_9ACTN|nr:MULTISPECIES: undecaprenyl-diphosphate phosphatase [Protofrankia]KLL11024.1 UDP pyrophosphate phosphatase [Protofrankia coriariae]ONH33960.1 undecaprenyl-diphosphatase UppP [Protofrankia sp. BMG5.30]